MSYVNALLSVLCASGANVQEVANGMGMDLRIGRRFLMRLWLWRGAAFPKDLSAFIKISGATRLSELACSKKCNGINAEQMDRFVKKILDTLWVLKERRSEC
ncbi:MAG: hypothetical protein U1G07_13130 [Verrucomicrobiota bacterium]